MQIMTNHPIRYLPVVQENKVLGLISIDVVKEIIQQQKTLIEELQKYISG
jgi:predicted transcriptional regulator